MRTAAALLLSLSPIALAGNAFYALGVSDPGFESFGWAVSDDGSTVVGYELGGDSAGPFFWTAADGVTLLHSLEVDLTSAVGVSADGAVLAGNASVGGMTATWRWDRAQSPEIELLPLPAGYDRVRTSCLSADGESIVGTALRTTEGEHRYRPFRWTRAHGTHLLFASEQPGEAYATSADGESVAGGAFPPFLWSDSDGIQPLPSPPDAEVVYAYAISGDGSMQAGESYRAGTADALAWEGGDYSLLQPLPGADYSSVYAISGNSSILAGRSSATVMTGYNAAVWDEQRRVIDPNAYFDSLGLDRAGLHLTFIRGLSHDGRVLAGWGERDIGEGETRREAWVAVLDAPISCAADITLDHRVDFADLNLLLSTFGCQTPDCPGDVNADGRVDFADLNEVLARFGLVCINPAER